MKYDFNRIKKQVTAEANLYISFSPYRIFSFLSKEIFKNDINKTKEFLLSDAGGFGIQEVRKLELHHQLNEKGNRYQIDIY